MIPHVQYSADGARASGGAAARERVLATAVSAVQVLKDLFWHADQAAIRNDGNIPHDIANDLHDAFLKLIREVDEIIGDRAHTDPGHKLEIAAYLRRELLPFICLTEHAERMYSKPRGYAGDYFTIYKMYQDKAGGHGRLGAVTDRPFLATPAALAVKNRRALLARELSSVVETCEGRAEIMSMACGPAQELFDLLDAE